MNKGAANERRLPMPGPGGGRHNMSRVNGEKPKRTKETLGRLFKYIGKSRYVLIALLTITLLIACIELTGPLLQGNAIDAIEAVRYNADTGELLYNYDANVMENVPVRTEYKVHFYASDYIGKDGHTNGMLPNLIAMGILFAVSAVLNFFMGVVAAKLSQYTVYTMRPRG